MKKIIIYCDHWQNGGVEAYIMNQLRYWNLNELHCTILSAEKTTNIYDNELKELNIEQVVLLPEENVSAIFRILKTFKCFRKYISNNPCDVIYLNLTNAVTMRYAQIAAKAGIKRRIIHSHASGIRPGWTCGVKLLAHRTARKIYYRFGTDYWACSKQAGRFLFPSEMKENIKYIFDGINIKKFQFNEEMRSTIRTKLKIDDSVKVIGTVGRCSQEKNQSFLLEVFARIYNQFVNTFFLLIGDGPLLDALKQKAKDLNIFKHCIFYGYADDVSPFYSAMDVFCLPSIVEGFGIVALEAQAAGCPCFLSNNVSKEVIATEDCDIKFLPLEKEVWEAEIMDQLQKAEIHRENIHFDLRYDVEVSAKTTQKDLLL